MIPHPAWLLIALSVYTVGGVPAIHEVHLLNFLSNGQGFSNFKGAREVGVIRVCGARVFPQRYKHLVLNDGTAVSSTDRLVLGALTLSLGPGVTPEAIPV